ncbi:MAG: hypothetical protein HETSPECPRED_003838 [Heterodermia speciosa]|uniref:Uncharacterized protein n=1 Tax=Heterodermia speciosa TaxID=116794 RepID=A0A8H3PJ93_9LECA|nr:MAG: hypothetical protein HETSPECPRED_003838 [Heterodermia speciosa]
MVSTRRSSGQSTLASIPTLYRKRQSASQLKPQPALSSPTSARTTEAIANPESNEEATNQTGPLSPARSSDTDNGDQEDVAYEVARSSHNLILPEDHSLAKPDSLSPAVPKNQTEEFQTASRDTEIIISTENPTDGVQGADQGSFTPFDHSTEVTLINDDSSDDADSTTKVSITDAMEGVQDSKQESDRPEDHSEDTASGKDSSSVDTESAKKLPEHDTMEGIQISEHESDLHQDDSGDSALPRDNPAADAESVDKGSTTEAMEWTGAPEPRSERDHSADEATSSTNPALPDANNPNEPPESLHDPAPPSPSPDITDLLHPSAYTTTTPPLPDPLIESPQQLLYNHILTHPLQTPARPTPAHPSPYASARSQDWFESWTLCTRPLLRAPGPLPLPLPVNVQAARAVSSRFDDIDAEGGGGGDRGERARGRVMMYDATIPSNLGYERWDPRRLVWRAAVVGNPDYFIGR